MSNAAMMPWFKTGRFDPVGAKLADRHYNRRTVGSPQFVPPGRCLVLITAAGDAVWVTSWPDPSLVRHAWPGAWMNSLFRREPTAPLASTLITAAVAATLWYFGDPPAEGLITFIDGRHVRHKRDLGRCYRRAGFRPIGVTKSKALLVLRLAPEDMPAPASALIRAPQLPYGDDHE